MRNALWTMVLVIVLSGHLAARDTLFGRSSGSTATEPAPAEGATAPAATAQPDEAKPGEAKDGQKGDGKRKNGPGHGQGQGRRDKRDGGDKQKDVKDEPQVPDEGVIIRPVKMDEGVAPRDRQDFQLSRIDKPLARETSAAFREAWAIFRSQNQLADTGGFARIPQAPARLKAKLLQDLGEGRWFVEAEWDNAGQFAWCQAGDNADKAVLVLGSEPAKAGDTVEVNATHVGLVELRFDCSVEPAVGRRITVRRHAFLATTPLPDDEATRTRFQQAVAAAKSPVEVVLPQVRDCKSCGGVGYIRRPVPGRIQDAHDPCPEACDHGHQRVPVLVTFKP